MQTKISIATNKTRREYVISNQQRKNRMKQNCDELKIGKKSRWREDA